MTMTSSRATAIAIAVLIAVGLTGCGLTWEQIAADKVRCEELGGTFSQWTDGLIGQQHTDCDFADTTDKEQK